MVLFSTYVWLLEILEVLVESTDLAAVGKHRKTIQFFDKMVPFIVSFTAETMGSFPGVHSFLTL